MSKPFYAPSMPDVPEETRLLTADEINGQMELPFETPANPFDSTVPIQRTEGDVAEGNWPHGPEPTVNWGTAK